MVEQADISIAIVDDGHIKKVNKEFLGCSDVTDVISFDLSDEVSSGRMVELIVNAQEAQRQANKRRHSAEAELALYVVHGFLHNVGFDDAKRPQAQRMHSLEDEILKEFGYGITYHSETVAVRKAKERG